MHEREAEHLHLQTELSTAQQQLLVLQHTSSSPTAMRSPSNSIGSRPHSFISAASSSDATDGTMETSKAADVTGDELVLSSAIAEPGELGSFWLKQMPTSTDLPVLVMDEIIAWN